MRSVLGLRPLEKKKSLVKEKMGNHSAEVDSSVDTVFTYPPLG